MAFHHRKLLNESVAHGPILAKSCEKYCDAEKSPDDICLFSCIDLCPDVCKIPLMDITPPPAAVLDAPREKSHRLSLFLTISLAVLAAAFFLFTCYTIYKFYSNWRSSRRRRSEVLEDGGPDDGFLEGDRGPVTDHHVWYIRTIGLQPSVIGAITIVRYKRGDGLIDGTDCSVCLNEFQEDETLRLLPKCSHAFHMACIDTWLRSHTNCPMCRAGIVTNNAAALPSQEQSDRNLGPGSYLNYEQGVSGSNREVGRQSENEHSGIETGIGIEDETVSRAQTGPKIDENSDQGGLDEIQPMRRSVSADSLSALANAFPGQSDRNSDNQSGEVKESTGFNQSLLRLIEMPIRAGPSSMKRSHSCSANVLLSRRSGRDLS